MLPDPVAPGGGVDEPDPGDGRFVDVGRSLDRDPDDMLDGVSGRKVG